MARDPYIVSVDFGSNSIKLVVARNLTDEENKMQILALVDRPSRGIRRGVITNMEEAIDSLSRAANQAETIIGLPIRNIILGVNGAGIDLNVSSGLAVISSDDKEITHNDVERLVQDSMAKAYSIRDKQILHTITKNFTIDNQSGIRNPIGMLGNKIEAGTLTISSQKSYLRNFTRVANESGLEIEKYIFSPLAASDFLLSTRQKKAGTIFIDLGHSTTTYVIWENEELCTAGIIPIGSEHITADLAVGLQTTIEMADEIKRRHLDLSNDSDNTLEEIEMYNPDLQINEIFKTSDIKTFSKARVEEIFAYINQELRKQGKFGKLPGGAVISGGGANLHGIVDVAKQVLRLPVFKYTFDKDKVEFVPDYNNDPIFFNAISAIAYYFHNQNDFSNVAENLDDDYNQSHHNKKKHNASGLGGWIKKILPF